jgi:hypothetical protein
VGSEPQPSAGGNLPVWDRESVGTDSRDHSQPLCLVAVHQINDHIVPMMALDLDHGFGVTGALRIGMAAKDETTRRGHEQREAQDECELNLIPAETISTP